MRLARELDAGCRCFFAVLTALHNALIRYLHVMGACATSSPLSLAACRVSWALPRVPTLQQQCAAACVTKGESGGVRWVALSRGASSQAVALQDAGATRECAVFCHAGLSCGALAAAAMKLWGAFQLQSCCCASRVMSGCSHCQVQKIEVAVVLVNTGWGNRLVIFTTGVSLGCHCVLSCEAIAHTQLNQ